MFCGVLCVAFLFFSFFVFCFLMLRRPPRSTLDRSSAASDVYKRQVVDGALGGSFVKRVADYLEAFDVNRDF